MECSFCPHKTLLFHLRFFHSSSPFITIIFFPCDRCDSKKVQLARECARVVCACVRMHADAHSSSQESLFMLSHFARLCHWLQFLVSPFGSYFAMLSFQFVLTPKFFCHISAIFSLFGGITRYLLIGTHQWCMRHVSFLLSRRKPTQHKTLAALQHSVCLRHEHHQQSLQRFQPWIPPKRDCGKKILFWHSPRVMQGKKLADRLTNQTLEEVAYILPPPRAW